MLCLCVGQKRLEKCGCYTRASREGIDFRIVEVQGDDKEGIDEIERKKYGGKCPGRGAREEEGVASSWVFEQELQ